MENKLVSFELAKLLNQLGFFWECKRYYKEEEKELSLSEYTTNHNNYSGIVSAPTVSMATDYIRNVWLVHVYVDKGYRGWGWRVVDVKMGNTIKSNMYWENTGEAYDEYEKCLDDALIYACTYLRDNKLFKTHLDK